MPVAVGKYAPPGISLVYWVTTMTDPSAPTASQLNAGVNLTPFVRTLPDVPRTANLVDVATLDNKFEARQVGTRGGDVATVEVLRDGTADTAITTLAEDTAGFLVLARKGRAGATFAASDKVDVFPAVVASVADGAPGRNEPDFAVISLALTANPSRNVTVS